MEEKKEIKKPGIVNPKSVTITIPQSINEKLEKIAKEDFINIESMIKNYISNKIGTYDKIGLSCDNCGKNIKEKEQYYSQENAFCIYEKIGDEIVEDKIDAWAERTLCIECKHKQDHQKEFTTIKVRHYEREPNYPIHVELKEISETNE